MHVWAIVYVNACTHTHAHPVSHMAVSLLYFFSCVIFQPDTLISGWLTRPPNFSSWQPCLCFYPSILLLLLILLCAKKDWTWHIVYVRVHVCVCVCWGEGVAANTQTIGFCWVCLSLQMTPNVPHLTPRPSSLFIYRVIHQHVHSLLCLNYLGQNYSMFMSHFCYLSFVICCEEVLEYNRSRKPWPQH